MTPKKPAEKLSKLIHFYATEEWSQRLEAFAPKCGLSKGEVIRRAVILGAAALLEECEAEKAKKAVDWSGTDQTRHTV